MTKPLLPPSLHIPPWPPNQDQIAMLAAQVIQSGAWNSYSNVPGRDQATPHERLVSALCNLFAVPHTRLLPSGTAAVEWALRACRVEPGDEVVLAAYDYPGNLRCIEAVGAVPVLVDILPDRWEIDADQVVLAISPKTTAIVASHLYQHVSDTPSLRQIADQAGISLIEDACQAPGTTVARATDDRASDEDPLAGTVGHVGTLSFGGSKLLTCGNGGAILTRDDRIAQRLRVALERPSDTYAMSQLQACVLIPQLEQLGHWNLVRRSAAAQLRQQFEQFFNRRCGPQTVLPRMVNRDATAALYKFSYWTDSPTQRDEHLRKLQSAGFPCGVGFPAVSGRARRRYRTISNLANSLAASQRSVVIDHRMLVASPELRSQLIDCLSDSGG